MGVVVGVGVCIGVVVGDGVVVGVDGVGLSEFV